MEYRVKTAKKARKSAELCIDFINPFVLNEGKYFIMSLLSIKSICFFNKTIKCFSSIVRSSNVLCLECLTGD